MGDDGLLLPSYLVVVIFGWHRRSSEALFLPSANTALIPLLSEAEKRGGKESVASIGATGTGIGTGAVTDRKEEQLSKPVANPEPDSI